MGRTAVKKRALSTNLLAFEECLAPIDSFNDVEYSDAACRARKGKAAANPLARDDNARLLKFGEKLRHEFRRDLL
jgi:hypothetical protein